MGKNVHRQNDHRPLDKPFVFITCIFKILYILEEPPSAAEVSQRVGRGGHLTTSRGNLANRLGHRNVMCQPRHVAQRLTALPPPIISAPSSTKAPSPTRAPYPNKTSKYSPIRFLAARSPVQTCSVSGDVPYNAYLVRRLPSVSTPVFYSSSCYFSMI